FNQNNNYFAKQNNFSKIPGSPLAYWVSENYLKIFNNHSTLDEISNPRRTLQTGDSKRFIRYWFEVSESKTCLQYLNRESAINSNYKWFMFSYGGKHRKWYGNLELVVNWESNGLDIKNSGKAIIPSEDKYFVETLGWSKVTSGDISVRYYYQGILPGDATVCIFDYNFNKLVLLAYMNSKVFNQLLQIINPTLNYQAGNVAQIPIKPITNYDDLIISIVNKCILISKNDWDSFETSWDFKINPLLIFNESFIENSFDKLKKLTYNRFSKIKSNEKKINEIFIEIYGLENELSPEIKDSEVTISKSDLSKDIKSFVSYSVGCMLGRYSLDENGLIYAGGQWDPSKYSKFLPDDDNIIPILDTEYFEDDIVGRFVEFVKVTFGEETLEENLDFIAKALKKKGTTSREIIRNYFLTDFYKDHVKTYKKHPIYWLFDSGRNNGFKALIYMHRYEGDLVARVRTDYLHKTQKALETAIAHNDRIIETSTSASEKSKAVKAKNKLVKQLEETRKYDEALAHVANQKIEIDLDDGVKVNYAKFQEVEVSKDGKKATKIDLLKKI
ncbi:MAG: BREX-1 system adenine-specific DNA-methyltransferase PglX, partial [Methanobacterium sp.]